MAFLRRRRFRLPASPAFRIEHLLIVAGPSGSGKSVFLRQLADGRLPGEIMAALPPGAADWPQTNGARVLQGDLRHLHADAASVLPGLVLHYDFLRIFETRIKDYPDDPPLAVLGISRRVTAVVIRPAGDRLAEQLRRKQSKRGLLWRVRHTLRKVVRRRASTTYGPRGSEERHARLAQLVAEADFLENMHKRWLSHIDVSLGSRLEAPVVLVEPVGEVGGAGTFRMAERTAG